ncbi:S41 family peptidase [Idiomarina sp.]|uniref:S41 family peptidase n=1 Tax=Idiomarina sp. TaxID=1874361 RepID=UPI0026211A8C|nr:S41 family peptidase [Idiomarina sp.]
MGVEVVQTDAGLEVTSVLNKSPAARDDSRLQVGDVITQVNQQSGKDGIVIDVRYNGGGWTTDYLMAVLNVEQHAYTIPRGATDDLDKDQKKFRDKYPYSERLPLSAWTKPSIAMSNENSYSNAEIFSHAYKALGIGKLVGRPTFGAVISTGAERLVDELLQSL